MHPCSLCLRRCVVFALGISVSRSPSSCKDSSHCGRACLTPYDLILMWSHPQRPSFQRSHIPGVKPRVPFKGMQFNPCQGTWSPDKAAPFLSPLTAAPALSMALQLSYKGLSCFPGWLHRSRQGNPSDSACSSLGHTFCFNMHAPDQISPNLSGKRCGEGNPSL